MRIYTNFKLLQLKNPTICGLGNFDGIHLGHQALIKKMLDIAYEKRLEPTIVTFYPHPSQILTPTKKLPLILTLNQKKRIFKQLGVKNLVLLPFNKEFSKITYDDFINSVLIKKCKSRANVVGFDYTFGYKGKGTAESLKHICAKKDIKTYIVPPITYNDIPISSSMIRDRIKSGDLTNVIKLMGRPFSISGRVVSGNGIGKKLGFPTANIDLPKNIILPPKGVYAAIITIKGQIYKGAANLGLKPTFNGKTMKLEVHLFDFKQNIYNENIEVFFIDILRNERRFNSALDLKKQVENDFIEVSRILSRIRF